ncbi:hypothetical protein HDU86_005293 [Geranomyces michiganensis]|nr:hypothetical protein HDU86_005293 [Geranomyces michiganensis]
MLVHSRCILLSRLARQFVSTRPQLATTPLHRITPLPPSPSRCAARAFTHQQPLRSRPPRSSTPKPSSSSSSSSSSSTSSLLSSTDLTYRSWLKLFAVAITGVLAGGFLAQHGARLLAHTGVYAYEPDDDDDADDDGTDLDAANRPVAATAADAAAIAATARTATAEKKADSHAQELAALFGDFRINVAYNWTAPDATYITLAREKLVSSLQELDAFVSKEAAVPALSSSSDTSSTSKTPSPPSSSSSSSPDPQQQQQQRPMQTEQDRKEIDLVRRFLVDNLALLDARAAALQNDAGAGGQGTTHGVGVVVDTTTDRRRFAKLRRWVGWSG